ncbi:hypothetical protein FOA52_009438 [Chlamydomonas sp. UWO 241]|nr:hypothetical protein FOA52_009438 [Chlamydomonas sp. UWO 241]
MAAARPLVSVISVDGTAAGQTTLPAVFTAPIRPDVVRTIHTNMAKNKRQAYATYMNPKTGAAGHQTAAESWGTGRAVSRIPRVPGGGTHRAGQAAFGNMCRGGAMFAPTKTWRRWHRKINITAKRHAVASALAASALPALVMARGHRIEQVPEVPLVLADSVESVSKTSKALEILKKIGANFDVEKAKNSKQIRSGKGKMRNRRYTLRKGPLVIFANDAGISKAFRNLPGVEVTSVDRLNLLQLAPGGHVGRFCIWTQAAFDKLDSIFGTYTTPSTLKKGYTLPRACMSNSDLTRLINSDEIQSVVRPAKTQTTKHAPLKKNPLKNLGAMLKLNPYAKAALRREVLVSEKRAVARQEKLAALRAGKAVGPKKSAELKAVGQKFYKQMMVDSEFKGEDYDEFSKWLGVAEAEEEADE